MKPSPRHPNSPNPICTVSSRSRPHPRFYPKDGENRRDTDFCPSLLSPPPPPQCLVPVLKASYFLPATGTPPSVPSSVHQASALCFLGAEMVGWSRKEPRCWSSRTSPCTDVHPEPATPGSSPPSSGQGGAWTQCPQMLGRGHVFVVSQGHHPRSVALGSFFDFSVFHFSSISHHREYMSHHRKYFRKE